MKRVEWIAYRESIRKEKQRVQSINTYQIDAVRKSKKNGVRRRHRI